MRLKTLENYINKCKAHRKEPTLKGAQIYKRYGIIV